MALLVTVLGIWLVRTSKPDAGGRTVIRWCVDPNPVREVCIALFEKKNPGIKVINDPDASPQRMLTQIAGGEPPDVMAVYDPQFLRQLARNDVLLDLTPYIRKYGIPVELLYPSLDPYVRAEGKIVGIPENVAPWMLFYNRKLFREAGIPYPKTGWTWDDCLRVAQKLTKYQNVGGRQVIVQKGLYIADYDYQMMLWMTGARMFSEDGRRCLMDSPEAMRAIRFWADMRLKYKVIPTASESKSMAPTGAWGGDLLLFAAGKVAMVISGRHMIIQFRKQKQLDWDVVSVPQGVERVTPLYSKCYAIPKSCRNRDAAIRFIRHLLERDNQTLIANYGDGLPSSRDPEVLKAFQYNPEYPRETNNQAWLDEMRYARAHQYSPYINAVDVGSIVSMEMDRMWLKEQSPEDACRRIARRINEIIDRNIRNPNFLD